MGFGASCECRCFFMPYVRPPHLFLLAYLTFYLALSGSRNSPGLDLRHVIDG
jgi:hypothetical protein